MASVAQGWQRHFETAFERSSTGMTLVDEHRIRVAVNDAFCRLAGRDREELLGRRLEEIVPPEYLPAVDAAWAAFRETGQWLGGWAIERPDGTRVEFEMAAVVTEVEEGARALFVCLETEPEDERAAADAPADALSSREREVINYVAKGHSSPEIADLMILAPTTIRTHVRNAMAKVGARTRAHLVAIVLTSGEILD